MSRYLEMVDHPSHVKKLTPEQLTELAVDVRQELIQGLAKSGGHLGPNLGVVELSIAMQRPQFFACLDGLVGRLGHVCRPRPEED